MGKVAISKSLHLRIRSFLRTLENKCSGCFKFNTNACYDCYAKAAKILAREMDAENEPNPNQTYWQHNKGHRGEKLQIVTKAVTDYLQKASVPLSSRKIKLPEYSWSMKQYTILKMVADGKLERIQSRNGKFYLYQLTSKGTTHENNSTRNGECEAR